MTSELEIAYTKSASAAAAKSATSDILRAFTLRELERLQRDGLEDPRELIMHAFTMEEQDYIMYPSSGRIIVDTCTYSEIKIETGPFAGNVIESPHPDTPENEVD